MTNPQPHVENKRQSRLGRLALAVVAATLLAHGSNFVSSAVAAHVLGPKDYGSVTAVLALLAIAYPAFFSLQTVVARATASLAGRGDERRIGGLLRHASKGAGVGGAVAFVILAVTSPFVSSYLHLHAPFAVVILGAAVLMVAVIHVQRGVLQGVGLFARYAVSLVVESVGKIGAALVLLLVLWPTVDGAVAAVAIGALVGLIANRRLLAPFSDSTEASVGPEATRDAMLTFATIGLLAVILALDVLAAKHYLDPRTAGIYAAASLGGKIVFLATSPVGTLAFPEFVARQVQGRPVGDLGRRAAGAVAVGAAVIVAFFFVAPRLLVRPLFGARFDAAAGYLGWLGLASAAYSLAFLAGLYLLARGDRAAAVVLAAGAVLAVGLFVMFHASIRDLVVDVTAVDLPLLFALGTLCVLRAPRHPLSQPTPVAPSDPF